MKLFATAFMQVFFVSANAYFIAHAYYLGVVISGFCISFLWTINVKRISISTFTDRIIYSSGACVGGVSGLYVSTLLL